MDRDVDRDMDSARLDRLPAERLIVSRIPEIFAVDAVADPEWKYVSLRRYLAYLEHSIDVGLQWAVFEPNDEPLWRTVQHSLEEFLQREWRDGALQGDSPEQAYWVRCSLGATMTQTDIDNGRLIVEVGVAPVRPAEFVIFRIGQWTALAPDC